MKRILLCLMLLVALSSIASAQDTPTHILNAAIDDLNGAIPNIGRPSSWQYIIAGSSSSSTLGCSLADAGTTLAAPVTVYQFTLVYGSDTYLYHISADASIVVPCDAKIPGVNGTVPTAVPTVQSCIVTSSTNFPIYTNADISSTLIMNNPRIGDLAVRGRTADNLWYMMVLEGGTQTGWFEASQVTTTDANCASLPVLSGTGPNIPPGTCGISATLANVRQSPSTDAPIVDTLETGETVVALGRTGDSGWYQIAGGWVAASVTERTGNCNSVPITGTATVDYGDCPASFVGYMQPRLAIGMQGSLDANATPVRMRANPSISAEVIYQIQPGTQVDVIGGPQCGNGFVWWQVTQNGQSGWAAESSMDSQSYFMDAIGTAPTVGGSTTGATLPAIRTAITVANSPQLSEVASLQFTETPKVFVGSDGTLVTADSMSAYFSTLQGTSIDAASQFALDMGTHGLVGLSPDGTQFAVAHSDGTLRLYSVFSRQELRSWNIAPVGSVVFSPDGRWMLPIPSLVAAVPSPQTLPLLSVDGMSADRSVTIQGAIFGVAFAPDGSRFVVNYAYGQGQSRLQVFDSATLTAGASIETAGTTTAPFMGGGLAFSPNGAYLVAGLNDGRVQVYDAVTFGLLGNVTALSEGNVATVAFNPDGSLMAVSGGVRQSFGMEAQPTTIVIYETTTFTSVASLINVFNEPVLQVAFSADGAFLLAASDDGTVRVFAVRQ